MTIEYICSFCFQIVFPPKFFLVLFHLVVFLLEIIQITYTVSIAFVNHRILPPE